MSSIKKPTLNGVRTYRFFYEFAKWTGALPMLLYVRPNIKFLDKKAYKNLKGGFLISSNHRSLMDPIILCCAFPWKRLFFIAQEQLYDKPMKAWLFSQCNCIKVDRHNVNMETFRTVSRILKDGLPIGIFPEGRIEQNDGGKFKSGCAMMALTNNVPVLPVCLGMRKNIWQRYKVTVGEPVYPQDVVGSDRSLAAIDKFNNYLYEKEKELEQL